MRACVLQDREQYEGMKVYDEKCEQSLEEDRIALAGLEVADLYSKEG
jgi:hypothetical protein